MSNPFTGKAAWEYDRFFETSFGATVKKLEGELLLKVLSPFRGGDLLEVGCGTGVWMEFLKKNGFTEPVGLDLSMDMLLQAKKKGLKKLVNGTALKLPFPDDSFDLTYFVTSLEFITDRKRALLEAARVSRKGILVAFLNRYSLLNLYRWFKSNFGSSVYSLSTFITKSELEKLARYVNEAGRKRLKLEKFLTTLNLSLGTFIKEEWERELGFNSPFGAFGVVLFKVKNGVSKRDNCRRSS